MSADLQDTLTEDEEASDISESTCAAKNETEVLLQAIIAGEESSAVPFLSSVELCLSDESLDRSNDSLETVFEQDQEVTGSLEKNESTESSELTVSVQLDNAAADVFHSNGEQLPSVLQFLL